MGQFQFKNISAPIEIFAPTADGITVPNPSNLQFKSKQRPGQVPIGKGIPAWGIGVFLALLIFTFYLFQSRVAAAKEKSIAVLPCVKSKLVTKRPDKPFLSVETEYQSTTIPLIYPFVGNHQFVT